MTRPLIFVALLFTQLSLSAQTDNNKKGLSILEKELRIFIDSARQHTYGHGIYNVYTVQLYNTALDSSSLSFNASYIENEFDYFYPNIKPRVFKIDTNIVLISAPPDYSSIWLDTANFEVLDNTNKRLVRNRLPQNGVFISRENAADELFVLYSNNTVKQHFCIDNPENRTQLNCFNNVRNYPQLKEAFKCDSIFQDKERTNIKPVPVPTFK